MLQHYFDRFAIVLSSICAIHCVALPLVASVSPLLFSTVDHGNALHEFWFHQFILIFILPISVFAFIAGYRCHKKLSPMLIGGIGLFILVFTAIFVGALISSNIIPHVGETWLTITGGIFHAIGHLQNLIATRAVKINCPVN